MELFTAFFLGFLAGAVAMFFAVRWAVRFNDEEFERKKEFAETGVWRK